MCVIVYWCKHAVISSYNVMSAQTRLCGQQLTAMPLTVKHWWTISCFKGDSIWDHFANAVTRNLFGGVFPILPFVPSFVLFCFLYFPFLSPSFPFAAPLIPAVDLGSALSYPGWVSDQAFRCPENVSEASWCVFFWFFVIFLGFNWQQWTFILDSRLMPIPLISRFHWR